MQLGALAFSGFRCSKYTIENLNIKLGGDFLCNGIVHHVTSLTLQGDGDVLVVLKIYDAAEDPASRSHISPLRDGGPFAKWTP